MREYIAVTLILLFLPSVWAQVMSAGRQTVKDVKNAWPFLPSISEYMARKIALRLVWRVPSEEAAA